MFGALVPCGGGDPIPLEKTRVVIGRERPSDVLLRHSNVSARHCELEFQEGYWFVRDLDSTNGIRVNGRPCQAKHVMPRDVLSVATHRFALIYTPQTDRPPPEPERPMHLLESSVMERAGLPSAGRPGTDKPRAGNPKSKPGAERPDDSKCVGSRSLAVDPSGPVLEDDVAVEPNLREPNLGELVPCGGGEPLPLLRPKVLIGRAGHCDIVLRYATVSARHCELEMVEGFWRVQDLGSHNGIRVDGEKCQARFLRPRSILSIATYRYEIVYTAAGKEPPGEEEVSFARGLLQKAGLVRRKK
jgi:pSer/pThr/pTyr-binding forkhead associated (FHA) protein